MLSKLSKLFVVCIGTFLATSLYAESRTTAANPIYGDGKSTFAVSEKSPEFTVKLKSNPTTGYTWYLQDYDGKVIEPVEQHFETVNDKKLIGAPGVDVWRFKVKPEGFKVPHQTIIRLTYARAWDTADLPKPLVLRVSTITSVTDRIGS